MTGIGYAGPPPAPAPAAATLVSRTPAASTADVTDVSSTAEVTMASLAVPTTVEAGDLLRFIVYGELLNNTGGNVNYLFKFYLGATSLAYANKSIQTTAGIFRRRWRAEMEVAVISTVSEECGVFLSVGDMAATPVLTNVTLDGVGSFTAAEDLTVGKNAKLTVAIGQADANADCISRFSTLEIIKRAS